MQTKYPKKQKTKVITNKSTTTKNNVDEMLTNQQFQIEELQTMATKSEYNNAYFDSRTETYERAYANTLNLRQDLEYTNNHAVNAHNRLDAMDLQLQTIIANGETNTIDLSTLTQKVTSNTTRIRTNELAIYDMQNVDETQNQNILDLSTQIEALQEQIGDNSLQQVDLTEVYEKIDENTQNIDKINNNFGSQIAENTANISYLLADVSQLSATVNMVENDNYNLTQDIENIKSNINQNQTDIDVLQNQVDINTQKIEALQNADPNTTELDLIDLTQRVEQNETDIVALQTQQSINMNDIAELMAFKQRFSTPADDSYQPKTFSDYPAGTILRSYACYERELNMYHTTKITTPYMYFLAEEGSAGNLVLNFDLSTEAENGAITIETYHNDTQIDKSYFDIVQGNNKITHNIYEIALNTETKQNTIYCIIKYTSSVKATLNYLKAELFAPNADIINTTLTYNVETFFDEYFVSDCSSGTAKLATIKIDDMYNMDNLEYVDLGFEAQSLNVSFSVSQVVDKYVKNNTVYAYDTKQNIYYIYSTNHDKLNTHNSYYRYDGSPCTSQTRFLMIRTDNVPRYASIYDSSGSIGYGTLSSQQTNVALIRSSKLLTGGVSSMTAYVIIGSDGKVTLYPSDSYASTYTLDLGYGTNARFFVTKYRNSTDYDLKCYVQKYDKIIEFDASFNSKTGITLNSTKEIGVYDDIFLGVRNDYFAYKNGKLSYHYFPTEETTDQGTEQTTDQNATD